MRDFTLRAYKKVLAALEQSGYEALTFEQYCAIRQGTSSRKSLPERYVILRHDVDKRPWFSVRMAEIEAAAGVKASYYFRIGKESNQPECIKRIAALGHEIGYHYEDLSLCGGDYEKAYTHFKDSLEYFRQFYPVQTCCMHGSPLSRYDNRALWGVKKDKEEKGEQHKTYDYHDLGLIGEPYFDVDFSKVFYLTDTGRCWDGFAYSMRDKVPEYQEIWNQRRWIYHYTIEVIMAIEDKRTPAGLMLTTHPQRWTDNLFFWTVELFSQNAKNMVKVLLGMFRK